MKRISIKGESPHAAFPHEYARCRGARAAVRLSAASGCRWVAHLARDRLCQTRRAQRIQPTPAGAGGAARLHSGGRSANAAWSASVWLDRAGIAALWLDSRVGRVMAARAYRVVLN